jgi:hypothetical protein
MSRLAGAWAADEKASAEAATPIEQTSKKRGKRVMKVDQEGVRAGTGAQGRRIVPGVDRRDFDFGKGLV